MVLTIIIILRLVYIRDYYAIYDNSILLSQLHAPLVGGGLLSKISIVCIYITFLYSYSRQGVLHTGHLLMYSRENRIADTLLQMLVAHP